MMAIREHSTWQRVYAACVFAAATIFFLWLCWNNRASEGSGIGLAVAAVCLWQAVCWVRLPKVLAVLQPGRTFSDGPGPGHRRVFHSAVTGRFARMETPSSSVEAAVAAAIDRNRLRRAAWRSRRAEHL